MGKNRFFLAALLLSSLLIPALVFADTYAFSGKELELRIPRAEKADKDKVKYFLRSARDPRRVIELGFAKREGKTYRAKINTKDYKPGLYHLTYETPQGDRTENIFIHAPLSYASPKLSCVYRQMLYFHDQNDRPSLNYYLGMRKVKLSEKDELDFEVRVKGGTQKEIESAIQRGKGQIISSARNYVHVRGPLSLLKNLSFNEKVIDVPYATSDPDAVVSEGVGQTLADKWHQAGFNGAGVKAAVLDTSFAGWQDRVAAGDLPANVKTAAFGYATIDAGLNKNYDTDCHGTECGEIVHDMAPGAELYLVRYDNDFHAEFFNAVDYLIAEGVKVISHSISFYDGPPDGTCARSKKITETVNQGITWVNSSGNRAKQHWEGYFKDNGKGYHIWSGNDILQDIYLKAGITIRLIWNDWGTDENGNASGTIAHQDYKIQVYRMEGNEAIFVDEFDNDQASIDSKKDPYEEFYFSPPKTATYGIAVKSNNNTGSGKYIELFVVASPADKAIEYYMPYGSSTNPGNAVGAIAVGAMDMKKIACDSVGVLDAGYLMGYSSQGPTNGAGGGAPDNSSRIKPDISAPTKVSTFNGDFGGTSAATPHVAGAAALVKQAKGFNNPSDVLAYLKGKALLLGYPAPENNQVGSGLFNLYDKEVLANLDQTSTELGVSFVQPRRKPQNWNGQVSIFGYNFKDKQNTALEFIEEVKVGKVTCEVKSVDPSRIEAQVWNNDAWSRQNISITANGKNMIAEEKYYVCNINPQDVTANSLLPNNGYSGWWGYGTLSGSHFAEGAEVGLGEGVVVEVLDESEWEWLPLGISVAENAPLGWRDLKYKNPGGEYQTVKNAFQVVGIPTPVELIAQDIIGEPTGEMTIESIKPVEMEQGYPPPNFIAPFHVYGKGFDKELTLDLGEGIGHSAINYKSDHYFYTNIFVSPTAPLGERTITVTNPDGKVATAKFKVIPSSAPPPPAPPSPKINAVSPKEVPAGTTYQEFFIYGENYPAKVETISLGDGIEVKWIVPLPPSLLKAYADILLDAKPGPRNVTVQFSDGIVLTGEAMFAVVEPTAPKISKIDPTLLNAGCYKKEITVYGTGFKPGLTADLGPDITLKVGGFNEVPGEMHFNLFDITIDINAKQGPRDITLTNPNGVSSTAEGIFSVGEKIVKSITPDKVKQGFAGVVTIEGVGFEEGYWAEFLIPMGQQNGYNTYSQLNTLSTKFINSNKLEVEIKVGEAEKIGFAKLSIYKQKPEIGKPILFYCDLGNMLEIIDKNYFPPAISVITRPEIKYGQEKTVIIKGENTQFEQGVTQVAFDSPLIKVKKIKVPSPTELKVTVVAVLPAYPVKKDKWVKLTVTTKDVILSKDKAVVIKAEGAP